MGTEMGEVSSEKVCQLPAFFHWYSTVYCSPPSTQR